MTATVSDAVQPAAGGTLDVARGRAAVPIQWRAVGGGKPVV
ncbi:hypothetical protein [Nocardia wallacei]|nr:hypothetical protein [Nocardia wallacei]